ncbi:MAG: hypothetical protein IKE16_02415 [Solobacterium sp.]|nr:hypothetical protein [Solobacterium sp.]MBR2793474.1 hypothetical protein [Solobacterium sp.]
MKDKKLKKIEKKLIKEFELSEDDARACIKKSHIKDALEKSPKLLKKLKSKELAALCFYAAVSK